LGQKISSQRQKLQRRAERETSQEVRREDRKKEKDRCGWGRSEANKSGMGKMGPLLKQRMRQGSERECVRAWGMVRGNPN